MELDRYFGLKLWEIARRLVEKVRSLPVPAEEDEEKPFRAFFMFSVEETPWDIYLRRLERFTEKGVWGL
ncbi:MULTISPECIES: hypothetical protein [unclassified Meiothermus]|uniref:hypothetical protein n=1 Tax=unclassified Meiothermus TaxID=370471 RepID=UPI000D7BDEF8|nr:MULTISPECIES: hypothetical protein [unclassified Meiothermus]PZA06065.1 hypothetical protein DNA98_15545 [Meiothermus sp. Pnk-1]RYM31409.1 hypothetical protein EWH23_14755 [Meiothermus sp. PNK-Is4]